MKENNKGKEILKILQENYEIETAQDLSGAIKDLFKDALQQMMNAEFDSSLAQSKLASFSSKKVINFSQSNILLVILSSFKATIVLIFLLLISF